MISMLSCSSERTGQLLGMMAVQFCRYKITLRMPAAARMSWPIPKSHSPLRSLVTISSDPPVQILKRTAGCVSENSLIHFESIRCVLPPSTADMSMVPLRPWPISRTTSFARSASSRIWPAYWRKTVPSGVSPKKCGLRSNSCTPSSSSRSLICLLRGGWAMHSFSAARVKFISLETS